MPSSSDNTRAPKRAGHAPANAILAPAGRGAEASEQGPVRLAILDRDSGFVAVLLKRVQEAGWHSSLLPAGISAKRLAKLDVDVLVVDPPAADPTRWAWLGTLCQRRPDLCIIVCSHTSSVSQRVGSLRMGVDDWLTKPCHPEELVARIEAITRRTRRRRAPSREPITIGEIEVRPDQYQAFVAARPVGLSLREFHLMELLARGGGEVQQRELIFETLWGREMARDERSVDACVYKLRRKLELASPGWRYIHTHYRIGYRLDAQRLLDGSVLELRTVDEQCETAMAA